ncbi:MAG: hypothetical protein JXR07_05865 [Reichenbachiella sp.]
MKIKNCLINILLIVLSSAFLSCSKKIETVFIYTDPAVASEVNYGVEKLKKSLQLKGIELEITVNKEIATLALAVNEQKSKEKNDGFSFETSDDTFSLSSESSRGLIYGLMDISEQIDQGLNWEELENKSVDAHYNFRAIKFNLPWFSYRSGENLSIHEETVRDLKFWEAFLDMMVENKFNAITLWNLHPYIYMVKPTNFPKASPFTDEEMAEWRNFFKTLFKMAKNRGIDSYVVNWNIFVSEEFGKEYGVAEYSSAAGFWGDGETNKLVEQYTREIVTQTINEYEDLTGIGITLGERMGGMTSEERRDWLDRTIIAGLKEADREARFIYRAPLSAGTTSHGTVSVSTERITREAIEGIGLENDVLVEFKFNWSHAHSSPKVSIVHGGILTDTYWDPEPNKYKGIWTMRNEDFFALRWAQPDFIRSFMDYNSQNYIGGCIIGSETYIPAKDYITKPEFRTWDYAFQRQWLFYKIWGNLLYNDQTSDSYFAEALAAKFVLADGTELLEAWKLASMNANRFASFYQGTWDATIYTEGFTTVKGKLINIDEMISHPVLDSSYVNIENFVEGKYEEDQITPLELANICETESTKAFEMVAKFRRANSDDQNLEIELNDIEAWSHYGKYFASKLRGGVALQQYRNNGDVAKQNEAVEHLTLGLKHWEKLTETMERYNVPVMPYQFDSEFSWRKHIPEVLNDIELAKK